jgi:hypothetical protein
VHGGVVLLHPLPGVGRQIDPLRRVVATRRRLPDRHRDSVDGPDGALVDALVEEIPEERSRLPRIVVRKQEPQNRVLRKRRNKAVDDALPISGPSHGDQRSLGHAQTVPPPPPTPS